MTSPETIAFIRLVIGEGSRFPEITSVFYENGPRYSREKVAAYLTVWIAAGVFRNGEPLEAATRFFDLIATSPQQRLLWLAPQEQLDIEVEVKKSIDFFLRAYRSDAEAVL